MDAFYEAIGILLFAFASTDAPLQLRFHDDGIHFRSFMTLGPAHQFFVKNNFFLRRMAFLEIIRRSSGILGKMAEHLEAKMLNS